MSRHWRAHNWSDLRSIAHAFHTTSSDHTFVARGNRLRCEHDGLESARADLVDGRRIRIDRQACTQGNLSCGGLADACLHDVAKVDLLYGCGFDFGLLEGALEGDDAEFGSGKGLEGTIERADRSAGSSDNDNFVWTVIRLKYG